MFRWSANKTLDSKCFLRLYSNHGRIYALAQQLRGAADQGVSYGAEEIAKNVFKICQKNHGLKSVNNFKFIQYIPKEANNVWEDRYSLVRFDWKGKSFSNPQWDPLSYEMVWRLLGERPPQSLLKDYSYVFTDEEMEKIFAMLANCLKEETLPERFKFYDPSEFYLECLDKDGLYRFIHHAEREFLNMSQGGELFIPGDNFRVSI